MNVIISIQDEECILVRKNRNQDDGDVEYIKYMSGNSSPEGSTELACG